MVHLHTRLHGLILSDEAWILKMQKECQAALPHTLAAGLSPNRSDDHQIPLVPCKHPAKAPTHRMQVDYFVFH